MRYVAAKIMWRPADKPVLIERNDGPERHITTFAKGPVGMSSAPDHLSSACLSCSHW